MTDKIPSDLISRVLNGENYNVPNYIDCQWVTPTRLIVNSIAGGFNRIIDKTSKPSAERLLNNIVTKINRGDK